MEGAAQRRHERHVRQLNSSCTLDAGEDGVRSPLRPLTVDCWCRPQPALFLHTLA
jgi:hypothetical protein